MSEVWTLRRFCPGMSVGFTEQLIIYEVVSFLLQVFLTFCTHKTVRVTKLILNLHNRPTEKTEPIRERDKNVKLDS